MLAAAIAVALSVWGPAPCPVVAYHVANLDGPLGVMIRHDPTYCEILIDAGPWRFWELCAVLTHEAGHAAGYRDPVGVVNPDTGVRDFSHSPDRRNLMFPRLVRRAEACIGKRPSNYPRGAVIRLAPSDEAARVPAGA